MAGSGYFMLSAPTVGIEELEQKDRKMVEIWPAFLILSYTLIKQYSNLF